MIDLVWVEGTPPELEARSQDAIVDMDVAVQCVADNPDCPVARAAYQAARAELENVIACMREFRL